MEPKKMDSDFSHPSGDDSVARVGSGVPARPTSPAEFVSVPRELVNEIEREFVGLEDLPAWIRRMQDEVRACRAADVAGPTLGELIAKVGGRINDAGYVEFGSEMAVLAMVRHARKAASEPTEEMLAAVRQKPHPTRPDGWDAEHTRIWKAMFAAATGATA